MVMLASGAVAPTWLDGSPWLLGADWSAWVKGLVVVLLLGGTSGGAIGRLYIESEVLERWTTERESEFGAALCYHLWLGVCAYVPVGIAVTIACRQSPFLVTIVLGFSAVKVPADFVLERLHRTRLGRLNWAGRNLTGVDLVHAELFAPNFTGANLTGATLSLAYFWEGRFDQADLTEADLGHTQLHEASFAGATLAQARFEYAKLSGADMTGANLTDANLRNANLEGAILTRAILRGAELVWADLSDARLDGADLSGADLAGVKGLTQGQFDEAKGDSSTKLPKGLVRPDHWPDAAA